MDYSTSSSVRNSNVVERQSSSPLPNLCNPVIRKSSYAPISVVDSLDNATLNSTPKDVDNVTGLNIPSFTVRAMDPIPNSRACLTSRRGKKLSASEAKRRHVTNTKGLGITQPKSMRPYAKHIRYMQALEQYVAYLYEQFQGLGVQPPVLVLSERQEDMSETALRSLLLFLQAATRNQERLLALEMEISLQLQNMLDIEKNMAAS
ncbi:hypothetical protein CVT26_010273 [Gymnopilus dilepis]|uniref:Uncharacterized protein n=1 Tax=Gymnopilus dilepis TaxID=231916 RepID=A0A409Y134_9AGAR|nr:hypothetical protein CVT26_010273 [Gymnopilus dilepis]